ncbi:hypothetical protein CAPTEDRAFT_151878 [Capitella teleta]|uniref:Exportin-4 n=1 Tax=Capitella teleta TaxID=283909 RepID=R7UT10_CAPTE|nr:hypothetical protein CAPTEDRAFT_151878 [Capitella teleta]|eukprot:ELU09303.1 hypothetical protein CAPTEDRAFT_151878 [Capitella teleta]
MEAKIRELEEASQALLAPPNVVSQQERQEAENVLLNLRKSHMPYELCHYILENCTNDYVLFHAASTLKEAVIREWSLLSSDHIQSLRSSLLAFVTQRSQLQPYVREQILATLAVIVKRARLDTNEGSSGVLTDIARLVGSGDLSLQLIACSLLTALLNEYSSSSRASDVGLPWELHCKCKTAFETEELQQVLSFCLQVLGELEEQQKSREVTAVFNRVLAIIEQVLTWDFVPKHIPRRNVGTFVLEQNVSFRPPRKWSNLLLKEGLVPMMFRVHSKVRQHPEMANHSLQCLSQLASLNGPVFADREVSREYLTMYITTFLHFLSGGVEDQEALGVASIISQLFVFFPLRVFASLPKELITPFLQSMAAITNMFCLAAAKEESLHEDDQKHLEALQKTLDAWSTIANEDVGLPEECITQHALSIFNTYLQCHLAPPEGSRSALNSEEDDEEYEEQDESDREKFQGMLIAIGAFGRRVPSHSLPLISRLLESRISSLNLQLHNLKQPGAVNSTPTLGILFEDLHWLLLVAGHVMMDEAEGETPMIPSSIMQYSIEQSKGRDCQSTLAFLATAINDPASVSADQVDPVVRLTSSVFRLCAIESSAIEVGLAGHISPEVTSSCMWFLRRWARAYLLPDETYYTEMSMPLTMAFGRDTEGGQFVLSFLINKVVSNIQAWGSEAGIIEDTLSLLLAMVEKRATCTQLVKCEAVWKLAKDFSANQHPLDTLPVSAKRTLCQTLVLAGSAKFEKDENKNEYWQLVLQSLEQRLQVVMSQPDLRRSLHSEASKAEVLCLLDCLCGVTEASRMDNIQLLFNFMHPMMQHCVKLLDFYHNYEEVIGLILEVFSAVANQQICYLSPANCKKFYEAVLSMMQIYAQHNIGRKTISKDVEDFQFKDLCTFMEMLTNILSKDFIDFAAPAEDGEEDEVFAVDVVLYGLNIIIPLMSEELLKFPALCSSYMRLTVYLAEIYPHKVCELPEDLLRTLFTSVDLGLANVSTDIVKIGMEFLTSIASHVFHNKMIGSNPHQALSHFLKLVFRMLLMESFDMDLMDTASETFFALICCHQELYQKLVGELLTQQSNSESHQRLLKAFTELTPPSLQLNIQRSFKNQFRENFELFLVNVRGFLCIK